MNQFGLILVGQITINAPTLEIMNSSFSMVTGFITTVLTL